MSELQSLCCLAGINFQKLSKKELILFEALFFARLYDALKELYRVQYAIYFKLIKLTKETENTMLEANIMRFIIEDILTSGEYNLQGIAYYTKLPEDVICEVIAGNNATPSAVLFKRIVSLHAEVRQPLYQDIIKKILGD
ncbi:MAG: hypothetical protein A3F12_04195 [Gammaproteobacteria bacterium RIFCSPHIGHO2_12_FULL_38_14]|nr:MAG: hypothetical protein A3F12_04195 [Gammaproteobacteria bacterium RIFCSPHIGHO2_12_FULL_38_14]